MQTNIRITKQTNGISKQWRDFESLKKEDERLHTFSGWICAYVRPVELAKAGFFYLKKHDHVQCAFCRGVVGEWEEGDIPDEEHRKHFSWCPFINGLPVGNQKTGDQEPLQAEVESQSEMNGYDTCERYIRPHSHPERSHHWNNNVNETSSSLTTNFAGLGILAHDRPIHEEYSILAKRIESFKNWPESLSQQPIQLATAGFFYVNLSDHVRCFHCDGGLRNWTSGDDPWEEHARWFSRCIFVLVSKGKEYVDSVLQNNPPLLGEENSLNNNSVKRSSNQQPIISSFASCERVHVNGLPSNEQPMVNGFAAHEQPMVNGFASQEPRSSNSFPQSESHNQNIEESVVSINGSSNVSTPAMETSTKECQSSDESRLCKVCYAEELGVAIFPCGHLCGTNCVAALKNCPICRGEIKGTLRIYM